MSTKTSHFKIGLFIIIATVVAIVSVILLGAGTFFRKKTMIETYFQESVQGLEIGSPLKFRGVKFGKVEEIMLSAKEYPTPQRYILVRVSMPSDVFTLKTGRMSLKEFQQEIDKGLRIRMAVHGLTGGAFLEMDYLDPVVHPPLSIDWTPRYIYIPSTPSTILRLSVTLEKIMKNLEGIRVQGLMDDLDGSARALKDAIAAVDFQSIGVQSQSLIKEVRETNSNLNRMIEGADIKGVSSKIAAAADAVARLSGRSEKSLLKLFETLGRTSDEIYHVIKTFEGKADAVPGAFDELKKGLKRINALLSKKEPDVDMIIDNFRVFSENLREVSENAKKNPSQFFLGKPPPPVKEKKK